MGHAEHQTDCGCNWPNQEQFKVAVEEASTVVPGNIPSADKLILYGLFKQANIGDNTTSAASQLSFLVVSLLHIRSKCGLLVAWCQFKMR